ncbi:amino acid ABC transporter substrate-binding protein [Vibrio sp. SS-MA-C1-2]|uniref:amino acid ABC transporter substrate-binding protein n=1 Tax=Vibrio sp. SS-MA-C1-2 TaxID=2908646 RepID=UPI00288352A6|nr:amino acid ABC transporter substrate-binding protein [Vibrio sp. SS-MA-C1-2]
MFKRIITIASLVLLTVGLVGCNGEKKDTATQAEPIRVGMSGTYYPFTFVKQGELQGFEVDLWTAIGKELNRPVKYSTANFSGLFGMLEAGKIDTISNQITATDARKVKYNFSQPYVYDGAQIVVRNDNTTIKGIDDLAGHSVAVNLGSNFEALLRNHDKDNKIKILTYDSGIEQDVIVGRTDAFVMDRNSALALITDGDKPLKLAGKQFNVLENAFPFAKTEKETQLRDQVNQALDTLRKNGKLAEISVKWFKTDITKPH